MSATISTLTRRISKPRGRLTYHLDGEDEACPAMPSFQKVVESCAFPLLIISARKQQPVVYVSPTFLDLSGYRPEDIVGSAWSRFFEYDSNESRAEEFRIAIRKGAQLQTVLRAQHRDGSRLDLDVRLAPLRNEEGSATHCVAVLHDVTAECRRREALEYRAYHDQLTGLANRHLLQDRFKLALAHARPCGLGFALVLLDLNGFKPVNDRLGHAAGDSLLRSVAARLKAVVREGDTVARLGGDEFALLIPESSALEPAETVVARVRESLGQPIRLRNTKVRISCCAGVAQYPRDGVDLERLLKAADVRLYQAKATCKCRDVESSSNA